VVIQAWAPALPNVIAFNSLALTRLGLTRDMPERIDNVWIETDAAGELTGRLHGSVTNYYSNDAFANSLWLKIPFLEYEFLIPGTKTAIRASQRQGVTAIYENHMMDKRLLDAYRTMRRANELEMRVLMSQEAESYGMPWSRPRTMPDFMARLEEAAAAIELRDERLRFNGVTVMWDGTCFPGGMMMNEVYLGPYGGRTTGYYNTAPDKVKAAMRFCAERRLRLNTMCMGNRANEENLRLLERLARTHDIAALNWVLVHSVFIDPEQVTRYKALNFSLTTSMSFCWGKGELFRKRIGDHVLKDLMPLRRFFAAGMAVAGASDWGPKNAWEQIQLSLTHEFCGSGYRNLGPDQKISREQALAMWTRDAATVMRWDDIGALVPGANADLVIVDRDPLSCPVEDISGTRVLRTVFAGDPVFDAGVL
jgi:predicted amidohydrolase YtcJ